MSSKGKNIRINGQIKVPQIRLVGSDGEMLGVVPIAKGLQLAQSEGLDLVEISPNAEPPVCKILDYGKYYYELQKKTKDAKKKQKKVSVKEIKISSRIAIGDYNIKLRNARRFIEEGNKVKVSLAFKGREIIHREIGFEMMERFKADMLDIAMLELEPKMEGRQIFMVFTGEKSQ